MIASQFFGHPRLRRNLGNHLFELASLIGMAKRYETSLFLPNHWQYAKYFELSPFINFEYKNSYITIEETDFQCCIEFFDRFKELIKTEYVNLEGFFQTEKYWKPFEKEVKKMLSFKNDINEASKLFLDKNNININQFVAISVRRGDFTTDPNHYLLPIEYYLGAYNRFFEDKDVMIFSDDIQWCKENFMGKAGKIIFAHNMNAIEQLSLMTHFQSFIIANSTFSWWGAYLSSFLKKKVVRPFQHFDGVLKQEKNIKDHYPEEWLVYNYQNDVNNKF